MIFQSFTWQVTWESFIQKLFYLLCAIQIRRNFLNRSNMGYESGGGVQRFHAICRNHSEYAKCHFSIRGFYPHITVIPSCGFTKSDTSWWFAMHFLQLCDVLIKAYCIFSRLVTRAPWNNKCGWLLITLASCMNSAWRDFQKMPLLDHLPELSGATLDSHQQDLRRIKPGELGVKSMQWYRLIVCLCRRPIFPLVETTAQYLRVVHPAKASPPLPLMAARELDRNLILGVLCPKSLHQACFS